MYRLSNGAAQDIEEILEQSLVEVGLLQTENYLNSLTRCLKLLGDHPEIGRTAEDIRPGYRRFPHKSHLTFYKPTGKNGILVVRILHHHMDASRHIQD
ncbi:MAG: type II toxin-antitoxin system RelE/ParE family toxin [Desulfurivibrionaceae bacterium]